MAVESCTLPFFSTPPPHPLSFFPPVLHFAPGSRPLCDGSSDSGKRSTGIPGWHTGPTGAKETWGVALTGPQRKGHVSQIIQCLCLLRFWQVDWLCLQRRPSDSRYQPLSALSATQTRTATAAADISARWVVPFASLLNVRKYQAVFNSILSFWSPSMTLFLFFLFIIALVLSGRVLVFYSPLSNRVKPLVFSV